MVFLCLYWERWLYTSISGLADHFASSDEHALEVNHIGTSHGSAVNFCFAFRLNKHLFPKITRGIVSTLPTPSGSLPFSAAGSSHQKVSSLTIDFNFNFNKKDTKLEYSILWEQHWLSIFYSPQSWEEPLYAPHELRSIIPADPKKLFDVREIIARVVDGSMFQEVCNYTDCYTSISSVSSLLPPVQGTIWDNYCNWVCFYIRTTCGNRSKPWYPLQWECTEGATREIRVLLLCWAGLQFEQWTTAVLCP